MRLQLPERRRFIRIDTPLRLKIKSGDRVDETLTKNVSPVGVRFEIGKKLEGLEKLNLSLYLPSSDDPIQLGGKVIWQEKTSLEDNAPYDVGVEILEIEDKKKNVLLKYLCDLLYKSKYKERT